MTSVQPVNPPDLETEAGLFAAGARLVACVDEAGRGPLAGGVHVGVVVIDPGTQPLEGVHDSKRLTDRRRRDLVPTILSWAVVTAVGNSSADEVDRYGIMGALRLAARRALYQLPILPDAVVIDGNYDFLHRPSPIPVEPWTTTIPTVVTLIHGDSRSTGVAAASVLAKTSRDDEMIQLDRLYPGYGWARNKGYGTAAHKEAMETLGLSPQHRRSFRLV